MFGTIDSLDFVHHSVFKIKIRTHVTWVAQQFRLAFCIGPSGVDVPCNFLHEDGNRSYHRIAVF
jgi:hypothetical protein